MIDSPKVRSPSFYRATIACALAAAIYLAINGRLEFYFQGFRRGTPPVTDDFTYQITTAVIWLVAVAPLLFAAWELGRQHLAARRLGYHLFVGLGQVFRIAFFGAPSPAHLEGFARSPTDRPRNAVLLGLLVAAALPAFFLGFAPPLRTFNGGVWLGVAGALMGLAAYCHRRAVAYLHDEPGLWNVFCQYRLLNPARYEQSGRPFVWIQMAALVGLVIWWLVGGAFLIG